MDKNISKAIAVMRMPVIVGPVMIHSAIKNIDAGSSIQYVLSSIIGEVSVPLFYAISGFLFFSKIAPNWYTAKLKSRVRGLLIPYLLWNLIAYLVYAAAGEMQWNQFLESFWVVEGKVGHSPADGPLWFVRTLMMAAVCSPIFFLLNKNKWLSWISLLLVGAWLFGAPRFSQGVVKGFVFFNFGAWLAFQKISLKETPKNICFYVSLMLFALVAACDISSFDLGVTIHSAIHRLSTLVGFSVFFFAAFCVKGRILNLLYKSGGVSFFVYCVHEPVLFTYKGFLVNALGANAATFILLVVMTMAISCVLCAVLNKYTPRFLHMLIGSR